MSSSQHRLPARPSILCCLGILISMVGLATRLDQRAWAVEGTVSRTNTLGPPPATLAAGLEAYGPILSGQQTAFALHGELTLVIDDQPESVQWRLTRHDAHSFDLALSHQDYAVSIRRREAATAFALPKHGVVFIGRGALDTDDQLDPSGMVDRCLTSRCSLSTLAAMLFQPDVNATATLLSTMLQAQYDAATGEGTIGTDLTFRFEPEQTLQLKDNDFQLTVHLNANPDSAAEVDHWPDMRSVALPRDELERQLVRGLRRVAEIRFPSRLLTQPLQKNRVVEHGELRWIEGHRVAILRGTPEQIGAAHANLLREEAQACIDSVLYAFGTVETIRRGRWFRHDLDAAYQRLSPHIPQRHKEETRSLARALGQEEALLEALNVFPELFHCSGFALFGQATRDGKLYHGRVLDYMTAIGLQDAATTFVVDPEGKIPFVNVGYAGFTGSVSGMNLRGISLGEMGGGGEGQWDGAPMATLMRRGLEECETLDDVISLWTHSPRTCEYYYVFADGNTNRAVGVAALPESIEFIQPGQSHPRLGSGIPDAVVLSAGSRLETLRQRVQERYGTIDESIAQWLMSRPVAMESNLHNVLFIPADRTLLVANADHEKPAAECHYVRLDLQELLQTQTSTGGAQ